VSDISDAVACRLARRTDSPTEFNPRPYSTCSSSKLLLFQTFQVRFVATILDWGLMDTRPQFSFHFSISLARYT